MAERSEALVTALKKATIKSYDAAAHKAGIQIAGSLAVWLDAIRVAADIDAAEVVAGRECTVLFFTDDNPDDAVVVTVHGTAPGGQLSDPTGVVRISLSAVTPNVTLTGNLRVDGKAGIGSGAGAAPDANTYLRISNSSASEDQKVGLAIGIGTDLAAAAGSLYGVGGYCLAKNASTTLAVGLDFFTGMINLNLATAAAVRGAGYATGTGKSITAMYTFWAKSAFTLFATITSLYGYYVEPLIAGTNRYPFFDGGTAESGDSRANVFKTATQFFSTTVSLGGGKGVMGIANANTVPSANPTGGGVLYAEAGALKWRGSGGTVTTIALA